ncbi:MAG: M13 family metallopeptidase [Eubacteriales bacterium]|nr:M13 family metallopeptidase [Eubacteriales bacterium]
MNILRIFSTNDLHRPGTRAAAVLLAGCVTLGSLTGCQLISPFPDLSKKETAEAAQVPAETGSAEGNGATEAAADASSQSAFTLPYEESDPAESASAWPWICSDLVDNVGAIEGLSVLDDFHAAINRDWLTDKNIPDGYVAYDSFSERQLEVDGELQEILKSGVAFSDPEIARSQKLVQEYYHMWLDWDTRNALGVEPLRDVIAPLLEVKTLEEMTAYLSDPLTTIEALPLCTTSTAANLNDVDRNAVYISPPSLAFSDPMYYDILDDDSWQTQPRYMYAAGYMLERLGYSPEDRNRILQESYLFECEMAAHMMTTEEQNAEDATIRCNNPRTLQELKEEQGDFPLIGMLEGAGVAHSDVFILEEPEWLECMRGLYDTDHLEKMKSYLLVQDVLQFMELLDRDCYDRMILVRNILSGSSGRVSDEKAAADAVNDVLEKELGDVYAETYVTDKTRAEITALIYDIIDYYRTMLEGEDFLSDATKAEALKKLDSLTIRVASEEPGNSNTAGAAGTSERPVEFRSMEEGGNLVEARIAISENTSLRIADRVNQPVDRTKWIASPQDVNAYYYPLDNSINIPAGILGGIFYYDDMSYEEKLAHVGVIAAHEISHAFDTSGRQYDEYGNLRNWWTEEDYRQFHARAQKLVDYYNGFEPISGYPVKGAMIDTEAIADLAGVKCVLRLAADIEAFDYALFFSALAQNWRCLTTKETEAYSIEQDSHPLSYLRTNAVVVQFEEFHRTFGTYEGCGMYLAPEYRLEVW